MNIKKESKKENLQEIEITMKRCMHDKIISGLSSKDARNKCRLERGFKTK